MTYYQTTRKIEQSDVVPLAPASLADILRAIERAPSLSRRQRQDITSAVRVVARLANRRPEELPCETKAVRCLLEGLKPARHGVSPGRWSNIRSLVYKALDTAGVPRRPGRSSAPISPAWDDLLRPLPYWPLKVALLPLARYCSRLGIEPEDADQSTFEKFAIELEELSGRARPRAAYLYAVRSWNRARTAYSAWPRQTVTTEDRRHAYGLPWSAFPPPLKADVDAMVADAVSPDPFRPSSRRPVKMVTAEARVTLLRAHASALVRSGVDPASLRTIADLLTLGHVETGLRFIHERHDRRKTPHLHQLAKVFCTLAQHWVQVPKTQLDQLRRIRSQVNPGRHGMTDKNRGTLRHFEDERLVAAFLSLPERVWRRHRDKAKLKMSEAVSLQIAVAIEILINAPIRCGNLHSIKLGENLIIQGQGRHRRVYLHFPEDAVKNGALLEFELPATAVSLLDDYLERVRPLLQRVSSPYLFPGEGFDPKGAAVLSDKIATTVEREVGIRLTAHQFRHVAGYLYLKANPGGHEVVRRLLGHRSIDTTLSFYAGMEVAEAVRHFDMHIAKRRAELQHGRPRRRRRTAP